jgi:hypothetical protein
MLYLDKKREMERVMGIEPTWPAWKAGALPLSYTREIWREQDSNLRRQKSADLQSAAINRSAISPSPLYSAIK